MNEYDALPEILAWAAFLTIIYYLLYRKYIYSVFDPLFILVLTTGFSGVLVLEVVQEQKYLFHYFACQLFLYIGFVAMQKVSLPAPTISKIEFVDRSLLATTLYILFVIYILANLYVISFKGSALFDDDPTARITNFSHGFGFIQHIFRGASTFLLAGFVILYITNPEKKVLLILLVIAFFSALGGSKSALLPVLVIAISLMHHPFSKNFNQGIKGLNAYAVLGAWAMGLVFLVVLSKSNDDIVLGLVKRLLYGADSTIFFYLPQNEYLRTAYRPDNFVLYSLNPLLSFIRVLPAVEPFGTITVENANLSIVKGDVYLAPNTPFYIEGQIFFGYYGAFVYSFLVGVIYSFFRKIFLSLQGGSYFFFAFVTAIFSLTIALLVETSLFTTFLVDMCFVILPIYIFVSLVARRKIIFRKSRFGIMRQ